MTGSFELLFWKKILNKIGYCQFLPELEKKNSISEDTTHCRHMTWKKINQN